MAGPHIAVVVIGRNEGERLKRCLRSLPPDVTTVYVDSGSTDGSVAFAQSLGMRTLSLDLSRGFTAARARNAGWRALCETTALPDVIQFVDGDCELDPAWIAAGAHALHTDPGLAAVFGRLRERYPDRSPYNRLCDEEWAVPVGEVNSCGGIAMIRHSSLAEVGGFTDDLIAGEEPDLCLRMRARGWRIRCIDHEMAWHDADIRSFANWWRRTRRSGYAYGTHVLRHRNGSDRAWRRQVWSIAVWGFAWPVGIAMATLTGAAIKPGLAPALIALLPSSYGLQVLRIAHRRHRSGTPARIAWLYASLIMVGKFAEFGGLVRCLKDHLQNRTGRLIEYKQAA